MTIVGEARGVLLDFHNTLAVPGSIDGWITQARGVVPVPAPIGAGLADKVRNVWTDAKQRFPHLAWDLDPVAHRRVFVSTLSGDGSVPIEFAEALYDTMPDQWALNTGAAEFIARAAGAGIRLALVSNTALNVRPALDRWGISYAFAAVILSYEVGVIKPDPRIFHLATAAIGIDPALCVMIGDSERDDGAAASIGIRCLIGRPDETRKAFEAVCPA